MFILENGFSLIINVLMTKEWSEVLDSESSRNIFIFFSLLPTLKLRLIVVFWGVEENKKIKRVCWLFTQSPMLFQNWVREHFQLRKLTPKEKEESIEGDEIMNKP